MYEDLVRYLNAQTENDPDNISVVKVAPTGKAAFNARGNALHSAFKIPANRGFNYCTLDRQSEYHKSSVTESASRVY